MEILATAKLEYIEGCLSRGPERLRLIINFKEPGKWFKSNISYALVSRYTSDYEETYPTYEEYINEVSKVINDKEYIIKVVEALIKEHFEDQKVDNKLYETIKKIKNMEKIKVTVKID